MTEVESNIALPEQSMDPAVEKTMNEEPNYSDEEHIEAVRKQIEYYFSKENLQNDPYLASQMDANKSVPIATIMRFAKLRQLTQDEEVVRLSLQNSTAVTLVNDRIRVNLKPTGRSTIILREIPSDATEEEIREIFNFEGCRPVQSMRPDIENTWFVVMESEDDVKDTVLDLQLKKRLFRGEKVKVRVKTESSIRSFYPVQPVPPIAPVLYQPYPGYAAMGMPVDMRSYPYIPTAPVPAIPIAPSSPSQGSDIDKDGSGLIISKNGDKLSSENFAPNGADRKGQYSSRSGVSKDGRKYVSSNGSSNGQSRDFQRRDNNPRGKGPRDKRDGKSAPAIEIDSVNFPPLGINPSEDTPIPTPGYKGDVIKYTFDDVINIVKNIKEAKLPEEVHPEEHLFAMTTQPNLDLLQRQRTFSIDETREQLQQGRPVQRLAVTSGEVDYGMMMYGDGYQLPTATAVDTKESSIDAQVGKVATSVAPKTAGSWAALVKSASSSGNNTEAAKPSTPKASEMKKIAPPPSPVKKSSTSVSSPPKTSSDAQIPSSPAKDSSRGKIKTQKPSETTNIEESKEKNVSTSVTIDVPNQASETVETVAESTQSDKSSSTSSSAPSKSASSWGGKPTFANILKQQSEAAAKPSVSVSEGSESKPVTQEPKSSTGKSRRERKDEKYKSSNHGKSSSNGSSSDNWRKGSKVESSEAPATK